MMHTFEINFNQIRWEENHSKMLKALERGFQHFEIDYYLLGAVAKDVWLKAINGLESSRSTTDVDFGVLINDKGKYELLRQRNQTQ